MNGMPTRAEALAHREETYMRKSALRKGVTALKTTLAAHLSALGSLFSMWDVDGSGSITEQEFVNAMDALAVPGVVEGCAAALFAEFDVDGSGSISYHEYIKFALRDALARAASRVMDLFLQFDTDHSGEVNLDEFRRALDHLGLDVPYDDVNEIFAAMDEDGSGSLTFNEIHKQLRLGATVQLKKQLRKGSKGRIYTTKEQRNKVALRGSFQDQYLAVLKEGPKTKTAKAMREAKMGKAPPASAPATPTRTPTRLPVPTHLLDMSLPPPTAPSPPTRSLLTPGYASATPLSDPTSFEPRLILRGPASKDHSPRDNVSFDDTVALDASMRTLDASVRVPPRTAPAGASRAWPAPGGGGMPPSRQQLLVAQARDRRGMPKSSGTFLVPTLRRRTIQDEKSEAAATRLVDWTNERKDGFTLTRPPDRASDPRHAPEMKSLYAANHYGGTHFGSSGVRWSPELWTHILTEPCSAARHHPRDECPNERPTGSGVQVAAYESRGLLYPRKTISGSAYAPRWTEPMPQVTADGHAAWVLTGRHR